MIHTRTLPLLAPWRPLWAALAALLWLVACPATAWAQAPKVSFRVEPTQLKVGQVLQVTVEIENYSGGLAPPAFPPVQGFAMGGTSTSIRIINGRQTFSQGMNYLARTPGTVQVPPFEVRVQGKAYQFKGKTVTVMPSTNPNAQQAPDLGFDSRVDDFQGDATQPPDIRLEMQLSTATCYAGEEVRLEVKCLVYETDVPRIHLAYDDVAEMMATYKLPDCWVVQEQMTTAPVAGVVRDGRRYAAVTVAQLRLYPLKPGVILLPALRMAYTGAVSKGNKGLMVYDKFYAESQPRTLKAQALPPPPPHLAGEAVAVGNFVLTDKLATNRTPALTPTTYTLTLTGRGNLSLLPPPVVSASDTAFDWEATNVEVQYLPFDHAESGTVVYTYALTPRREGVQRLQPPVFYYFNPQTGRYDSLRPSPTEVLVLPAYLSAVGDDFFAQRLAQADATLRSRPLPLPALLAGLLAFMLLAALLYRYGRQMLAGLRTLPAQLKQAWQLAQGKAPSLPAKLRRHKPQDPFA